MDKYEENKKIKYFSPIFLFKIPYVSGGSILTYNNVQSQ